ncbi:trigger factor [Synergistaceae bacterium OttesenSCG-928-I11]|nr:trigger factor [Synergistaceae bacterium OttesenSCG-928-I11]
MKSEILSQERNVVVVKSVYEASEVDKAVSRTVRELSNKVNIKGFRKGHVPRKTLEMYFGRGAIYKETLENLAQSALEEIVSEYDLDLVANPNLDVKELREGEPLEVTFTFEVRPEVKLPDIATLEAEKIVYRVEDVDVDEELHHLLEANAKFEPTGEDREATMDDIVETQYTSYRVEGEDKAEALESDQKNTLHLSTLRKDIAESIVGHKLAEEFSFDIKLEDDYPDERMAGATLRYDMEILQFLKRVVPEETDETIEEITKGKYKAVDEIKAELKRQMEQNASDRSDATLRESALTVLSDASEVDVPDTMVERQYESMRRDQSNQVQRDLNQSLEEYLEKNNLNVAEFENNLRKRAAQAVRNSLVLDALAERDEISFTSDELNEEIIQIARSMRANPQELADMLSKNRDEFASVANRVRTKNTLTHLTTLVKVKEVDPPAETPASSDETQTPDQAEETSQQTDE